MNRGPVESANAGERATVPAPSSLELPESPAKIRTAWERFLSGSVDEVRSRVRELILERWLDCQRQGVSPRMDRAPTHLERAALEEIARTSPLTLAGIKVLENFAHVAETTEHTIVLADHQGRILAQAGDSRVIDAVERINFCPGGLWDEAVVGPNGIGTAISTGHSVFVFGPEHFCEGWQPWVCYGNPIRDPNSSRILGVVDLTGPAVAAVDRGASAFTASLARCIERELVADGLRRRQALRDEFVDAIRRWPSDGVLVVDEAGYVAEASPCVSEMIGCDFRSLLRERIGALAPEMDALVRGTWSTCAPRDAIIVLSHGSIRACCSPIMREGRMAGAVMMLTPIRGGERRVRASAGYPRMDAVEACRGLARFSDILGTSEVLQSAVRQGRNAARTDHTVLLIGESGTGKELFAQAIHAEGRRAAGPFIAVNCAAIPRELFESELFGYARGAFTGGRSEGAAGKFEAAAGGTLFLDEISAMPPDLQSKLLRVLETNTLTRLGSHSAVPLDLRVIAASNEDLRTLVKEGRFRLDLFYRLNVVSIRCPALRERPEDVPVLARFFIARESSKAGHEPPELSAELEAFLRNYEWPGNVRELKNLCARWAVTADGESVLTLDNLPEEMRLGGGTASAKPGDAKLELTIRTLNQMRHNVTAAARALGISRAALYQRLKRAGWSPRCGKGC